MLHVYYKKWLCHPVEFEKGLCCSVEFKKGCVALCQMSLRPKKHCVALSILGVYTQQTPYLWLYDLLYTKTFIISL